MREGKKKIKKKKTGKKRQQQPEGSWDRLQEADECEGTGCRTEGFNCCCCVYGCECMGRREKRLKGRMMMSTTSERW
jgi:hypothetical protein